jgi:radical SAM protein with 4Fe4S-binding SPASM domain
MVPGNGFRISCDGDAPGQVTSDMKKHERARGLRRTPRLLWDVLVRGAYSFVYDCIPFTASGMSVAKRVNLLRAGGNLVHRRLDPWGWPLHMQFEWTNYCNLRCPVCPVGAGTLNRPAQAMQPALFAAIMDEVGPHLLTASLWVWGESLLHPNLPEMLGIAGRHPVITLLSTNGFGLDQPEIQDALLASPPHHLIVAIDGLTDETNTRYRPGAKLAPMLAGVRQIAEKKRRSGAKRPILHMRTIVMKQNQHEIVDIESFAREHGFEMLSLRSLSIIDDAKADDMVTALLPDQSDRRAYGYDGGQRVRCSDFICQQPFWFPSVLADGTVVACEQDFNAQHPMGRVSETISFGDVWHSTQAREVRRLIRDAGDRVSFCRNCPFADRPTSSCSLEMRQLGAAR